MLLVQVVYNVLIQVGSVPAMLASKVLLVTLRVVVILLGQVVQHVMLHLGSVLAILATLEQHVIPVPPTTTEKAMELAQVCILSTTFTVVRVLKMRLILICFQLVAVMPLDQAVCNVQIHLANVHAMPAIKALHVTLLAVVILLVQVEQPVMPLQVNVLVTLVILALHVIHVLLTTIEQFLELVQVSFTLTT